MVSEVAILPEMLIAGAEAVHECHERDFSDVDTAIAVYLAMTAVYQMAVIKEANETRH